MKTHKHKGVERNNGTMRAHPIDRQHKDTEVQKYHNNTLGKSVKTNVKEKIKNVKQLFGKKKQAGEGLKNLMDNGSKGDKRMIHVDKDGYMSINLDDCGCKGLRLTFTRAEAGGTYGKKKTVGIQFENQPARKGNTYGKKLEVDEQY